MSESKIKGCLNFEGVGKIIAILKDDHDRKDGKKNRPNQELYVCDNREANEIRFSAQTSISLPPGYHFQLAINKDIERMIGYIVGASGSGKSYFCKQFISEYHKAYPTRPVYIISALAEDPTLDSLKYIQRIKLTDSFVEDTITASDFQDSLLVLDDTDTISQKKVRNKVNQIRDDCLSTGRHFNVSLLVTAHQPCRGAETKLILNESHFFTIFLMGLQGRAKSYLLESYLGLNKKQIKKLNDIDSRAVTIIKNYPQVILAERNAYILTDL